MLGRLLVVVLLGALLVPATAAAAPPNLERVVVSRTPDERVSFRIEFAEPVALRHDTIVQVAIDADRDAATGIDGLDYSLDWRESVVSSADLSIPEDVAKELRDALTDLTKPYVLLTAVDGEPVESHPRSLTFSHADDVVTFSIAAADIGGTERFDFYAFIEQDGELDEAPSHVLFGAGAVPWTYPRDGARAGRQPYPTQVYDDPTDTTLSEAPAATLVVGALVLLAIGGSVAIVGWSLERHRRAQRGDRTATT
ncbi:MAG TPA: hypothetical protein VFU99_01465 [Gaiellaceae bacterium]|nr:hypothetical protein [Gaiellaceae bacterium]